MSESFEELQKRSHYGQWSFDTLLSWYHDQGEEVVALRAELAARKECSEERHDPSGGLLPCQFLKRKNEQLRTALNALLEHCQLCESSPLLAKCREALEPGMKNGGRNA